MTAAPIAVAIAGFALPIVVAGWLLRHRHRVLQRELSVLEAASPAQEDDARPREMIDARLSDRRLVHKLRNAIAEVAHAFDGTRVSSVIASLRGPVVESAASTIARAIRTGTTASRIVRVAGTAAYIVALPVRRPGPGVAQRYLGAPWRPHVEAIQRAAGSPLLTFVVLCGPAAAEASVLVGFVPAGDPSSASHPEALLDARTARESGTNRFHHVMTLSELAPSEP
jgi:hypothetical protein